MKYSPQFMKIYNRLKINEGGFQKMKNDKGNWTGGKVGVGELKGTNCGVSAASYPDLDIENLTKDQIMEIYHDDWYVKLSIMEYPSEFQYQVFDAMVHHGSWHTSKMIQRAVGANPDGIIGEMSWSRIKATPREDMVFLFLAERCRFMAKLSDLIWGDYGRGFMNRIAKCLDFAAQDN